MTKFDVFESWLLLVEGRAQRFDCSLITGRGYLGKCLSQIAVIEVFKHKGYEKKEKMISQGN